MLCADGTPKGIRKIRRKPYHAPLQDGKSANAGTFLALIEQNLQAETDSQKRGSALTDMMNHILQSALPQLPHGIAEGTDSRENHMVGTGDHIRISGCLRTDAEGMKCIFHTAEIPCTVINNRSFHLYLCMPQQAAAA